MGEVKSIQKSDRADIQMDEQTTGRVVESLVLRGDISALTPEERSRYYVQLCKSLGLSPAALPFTPLRLNGKEILYASRTATDQLAAIHRLTREIVDGPKVIDLAGMKLVYAVCKATHPNGRSETAVATVPLTDPVNVLMKCETKAKRRATLSILGLGMLDETEVETILSGVKSQPRISEEEARHRALEPNHEDSVSDVMNVQDATLDALREDLAPLNDIEFNTTLLNAARVWRKHSQEIYTESGSDLDTIHEAQQLVLGVTRVGCTTNQLIEHAEALTRRAEAVPDGTYATVMDLLELTESSEDVVEVWRTSKSAIESCDKVDSSLLRKIATRRIQELVPGMADAKQAAQWLKTALAPKEPKPPSGSDPKPSNIPVNDADDPERAAIEQADSSPPAPVASLEDKFVAYVASKSNVYELQNGIEKHFDEFKPSREQLVRIVVPRLVELSANTQCPLTQMGAVNVCRAIYANAKPRKKGKAA